MNPSAASHLPSAPNVGSRARMLVASDPLTSGAAGYGSIDPARVSEIEKEKVRALPNLMDKLKAHGIDQVYYEFRDSYQDWRQGGPAGCHGSYRGSVGELTMEAIEANTDPYKFEFWYPTPGVFRWRFTAAYWIAILFLQGSFFFAFDAGVQAFHGRGVHLMGTWPNFVGSICFTVAAYFIYLQLINIGADDQDELSYFYANWDIILKRVGLSSCIGTMGYVLGALFFQIGVVAPVFHQVPAWVQEVLVVWPCFIGSIGFVVGGVSELVHNEMLTFGTTPADTVWWASLLNFVGSLNFLLATAPPLVMPWWTGAEAAYFMSLNMFIGSCGFVLSSILLIVMWEGNDFGLTLFYQLNKAIRANAAVKITGVTEKDTIGVQITASKSRAEIVEDALASVPSKFDMRGTMFLVIYCWFVVAAVVDCLCQELWFRQTHDAADAHEVLLWTGIATQVFVICAVLIVLLIHSVVTHIPHEQPYHAAMLCCRFVMVIGAVNQTVDLAAFLTKFGTRLVVP